MPELQVKIVATFKTRSRQSIKKEVEEFFATLQNSVVTYSSKANTARLGIYVAT